MSGFERWTLRAGSVSVAATGFVYGYLRYFCAVHGEFGPEPHPWQGLLQHAHVVAAPVLVFGLGVAVRGHALGMLKHHVTLGRRSGLLLLALIAPMVLSGYGIQVVTEASTRTVVAWVHGIASVVFVVVYGTHWLKRWRGRSVASVSAGKRRANAVQR